MIDELLNKAKARMDNSVGSVQKELSQIRTGRATTALLDSIRVECYGKAMPVNQVASISTPEVRLLMIQPWDKNLISGIEKAILKSDLGLNPANDGTVIRLAIPQLTEERRKELVKLVKKFGEDGKISVRNVRRDVNEKLKKLEKDKQIREDELYRAYEKSQEMTDEEVKRIDTLLASKEEELMQV